MRITADSPTEDAIRDGHRALITTLREFARDLDGAEGRLPEADVSLGIIAFLRQGLLPFAQWEETRGDGCAAIAEDTAFEHAFLGAEVDALAAAVADLDRAAERSPTEVVLRIRRHVHRIEAVLELHAQKAEDRERRSDAPGAEPEVPREVRELGRAEIHAFLRGHDWGVLCTVGEGTPYGVPVSYGFDGRFLYLASGPGRKRGNLETSSPVCVTVVEVRDGDRWSSVVITGEAVRVNDFGGKLRALAAIRRQRATGGPPAAVDLARIARAAVFRIDPVEVTGRARGPVL